MSEPPSKDDESEHWHNRTMPLPHRVARFNKRYTNRFIEPVVRRAAGFAVVHHVGRRSGTSYATPVKVFHAEDGADRRVFVALTYGPQADWVQNVLAAPATIDLGTGARPIDKVDLVGRAVAWRSLPRVVRVALRILRVHLVLAITVEPPVVMTGGTPGCARR